MQINPLSAINPGINFRIDVLKLKIHLKLMFFCEKAVKLKKMGFNIGLLGLTFFGVCVNPKMSILRLMLIFD